MTTVPDGLFTRDQNRSRTLWPTPFSARVPNESRSLFCGGIEPVTIVGTAWFSLVPCPNESSLDPLGLSFTNVVPAVRSAAAPAPLPGPVLSQSRQFEWSSERLAPLVGSVPLLLPAGGGMAESISNLLPDKRSLDEPGVWPSQSVVVAARIVPEALSAAMIAQTQTARPAISPTLLRLLIPILPLGSWSFPTRKCLAAAQRPAPVSTGWAKLRRA